VRLVLDPPGGHSSTHQLDADTCGIELIRPEGGANASAIAITRVTKAATLL